MRRSFIALLCTVAVSAASLVALASPAAAEPGDFDGAFGNCGFAVTSRAAAMDYWIASDSVIRQSTGRTLHVYVQSANRVAVTRLLPSGAVDRTYGTNGTATTDLAPPPLSPVRAAHAGAGNRLYVVGSRLGIVSVEALDRDGHLDATFDGDGIRPFFSTQVATAAVQSDGRLVIGYYTPAAVIQRINLDGSDDPTFVLAGTNFFDAHSLILMAAAPDDQLYVMVGNLNFDSELVRLSKDGAVDPAFTFDATVPVGRFFEYRVTDIDPIADGTVIVATRRNVSTSTVPQSSGYLARYTSTGSLDPQFSADGWTRVGPSASSQPTDVSVQGDGSALISGVLFPSPNGRFGMYVTRRNTHGARPVSWSDRVTWLAQGQTMYGLVRGLSVASGSSVDVGIGVSQRDFVGSNQASVFGVARVNLQALQPGAGLMLQWDGTAWPTRLGSDPGPECPDDTPYWQDDDNARGITTVAGKGGYVVDLFGALHPFSIGLQHPKPAPALGGLYWPGWDIVRGVAAERNGTGGLILDGFGGLHPFHTGTNPQPPLTINGPYWLGWDITRGVALMPDGFRGYILDGSGGLHRFTTPGHPLPPRVTGNAYWLGWDIARGVGILGDGTGGYIVDAYGGTHPFGIGAHAAPPGPGPGAPYAAEIDWVRGYTFVDPKPVTTTAAGSASAGATTDSSDALIANAQRRGPTPAGPASP